MSNRPNDSYEDENSSLLDLAAGRGSVNEDDDQYYSPPTPQIFVLTTKPMWSWMSQRWLLIVRIFLAIYMTVVLIVDLVEEWTRGRDHGVTGSERMKGFFFFLSNVVWCYVIVYYWLTSYWTYLEYTKVDSARRSERFHENKKIFPWNMLWAVDHVPQGHQRWSRLLFSFYYTLVVTLPFVVTLVFWLILVTETPPFTTVQKFFCVVNIHAINSGIAIAEITVLNRLPRQRPIWLHILMMLAFSAGYVGWVALGRRITGFWPYRFIDPAWQGRKHVVTGVLSATGLALVMFAGQYATHVLKHMFAKQWRLVRNR